LALPFFCDFFPAGQPGRPTGSRLAGPGSVRLGAFAAPGSWSPCLALRLFSGLEIWRPGSRVIGNLPILLAPGGHPVIDPFDQSLQGRQIGLPVLAGLSAQILALARAGPACALARIQCRFVFAWSPCLEFLAYLGPGRAFNSPTACWFCRPFRPACSAASVGPAAAPLAASLLAPVAGLSSVFYPHAYQQAAPEPFDFREQENFTARGLYFVLPGDFNLRIRLPPKISQ